MSTRQKQRYIWGHPHGKLNIYTPCIDTISQTIVSVAVIGSDGISLPFLSTGATNAWVGVKYIKWLEMAGDPINAAADFNKVALVLEKK